MVTASVMEAGKTSACTSSREGELLFRERSPLTSAALLPPSCMGRWDMFWAFQFPLFSSILSLPAGAARLYLLKSRIGTMKSAITNPYAAILITVLQIDACCGVVPTRGG